MKKVFALAAATVLLTVGSAAAKTVTVSITRNGFVPRSVALAVGDSVTFLNQDAVAHQVVLKPTTGVTCTPTSLVIQPAATVTCAFQVAGKYTFTEANQRRAAFRGTITVSAAPGAAVTLKAAPTLVTYGVKATLSGRIATGQTGQKVDVMAKECGQTAFKAVTSTTTTSGGSFTTTTQPLKTTAYEARFRAATSAQSSVRVRPGVRLARVAPRRFALRVRAADSFVGKVVTIQRYRPARRAWTRVRLVTLRRTVASVAPTVVTAASFKARVRRGARVRAVLPAVQAAPCYARAVSNVVRS